MKNIKAIIFDLGGVILNIDFRLVHEALTKLGVKNADGMYEQERASSIFKNLESGDLSPAAFCNIFRKETALTVSDDQIISAMNSMLLDFRSGALEFIERLRKHYKVYILSNTNAIHREAFDAIYASSYGSGSFTDLFDAAYFSHEIGVRKPAAAAYQYVLDANSLAAEETLFVDDTIENVTAAEMMGLQGVFLGKEETIEEKLADLI